MLHVMLPPPPCKAWTIIRITPSSTEVWSLVDLEPIHWMGKIITVPTIRLHSCTSPCKLVTQYIYFTVKFMHHLINRMWISSKVSFVHLSSPTIQFLLKKIFQRLCSDFWIAVFNIVIRDYWPDHLTCTRTCVHSSHVINDCLIQE